MILVKKAFDFKGIAARLTFETWSLIAWMHGGQFMLRCGIVALTSSSLIALIAAFPCSPTECTSAVSR